MTRVILGDVILEGPGEPPAEGVVIRRRSGDDVLTLTLAEARDVQALGLPAVLSNRQTSPQRPQTSRADVHRDT